MSLTYSEAVDEMFALFLTAWNAGSSAIAGYIPEIRWQGKEDPSTPDSSKFWCRVSVQSVFEEQAGVSALPSVGKRRYESSGLLFVQIFCPKSKADSFAVGRKLAELAKATYRGKTTPCKVIFQNVRINELPIENLSYRFNVIAEYEYDEIS